ncbi:MAG TPA: hypothetical protein PLA12_01520 [Candidatus Hydrogenedens sp.]|nr:hypothetical protein [Candidatus Hydrogenedens sp.]
MTHLTDEQISELLDGFCVLNQKQQEHLQHCPECKKKLEEWQSISICVQNLPVQSVPDELTSRINYKINSIQKDFRRSYFPSIQWNYKFLASSIAVILLIIFGITVIYNNYDSEKTLDKGNSQPVSDIGPIASNNNGTVDNPSITEQISMEDNILNSISEQYINLEPFEEELHDITISELLLSLAEETEEYNISDVSL